MDYSTSSTVSVNSHDSREGCVTNLQGKDFKRFWKAPIHRKSSRTCANFHLYMYILFFIKAYIKLNSSHFTEKSHNRPFPELTTFRFKRHGVSYNVTIIHMLSKGHNCKSVTHWSMLSVRHCPISTAAIHTLEVAVLAVAAKVILSNLSWPIRSRWRQAALTNHTTV